MSWIRRLFSKSSPQPERPPTPEDTRADGPSRLLIAACFGAVVLISIFIVAAVCFQLLKDVHHPVIEALILAVIAVWASAPLAASDRDFLLKTANYAAIAFPILYFIDYQTPTAFWLALAALVAIVLVEHKRRLDNEPLYTKIAQTITIISVISYLLRKFTEYFLPSLQTTLAAQFSYFYQLLWLREALALVIVCIIIYGSAVNVVHRLQLSNILDFGTPPDGLLASTSYYTRYFFRVVGKVATIIFLETLLYIYTTFFSPHLWWTILYITSTAAVMALLVVDVILVQPYLTAVLRNAQPFFAPSTGLLLAYGAVIFSFAVAVVALFPLTRIWLPRTATRDIRDHAYKKVLLGAAGILACIWIVVFGAWVANRIFGFDRQQFVDPGYFTALALVFVVSATIVAFRSGRLQPPPDDVDNKPPPATL